MSAVGFIPLLVDSLLLDPEHPRRDNAAITGKTDWNGSKGPVQRVRPSQSPRLPALGHIASLYRS